MYLLNLFRIVIL